MNASPQLVSVRRAAREAEVTQLVIKRLIESGTLDPVRLHTGRLLIPRAQLDRVLSSKAAAH